MNAGRWAAVVACALSACQFASGLDELHTRADAANGDAMAGTSASVDGVNAEPREKLLAGHGEMRTGVSGNGGHAATLDSAADGGMVAPPPQTGEPTDVPVAGSKAVAGSGGSATGGGGSPAHGNLTDAAGSGGTPAACSAPLGGGAACDPVSQCGCAADENCALYGQHLACVRAGAAPGNHACNTASDCQRGYQCDHGACLRACDQSHPDCPSGAMCDEIFDDTFKNGLGLYDCDANCNLVDPQHESGGLSACGPELTCTKTPKGSGCSRPTGGGTHGQLCDGFLNCAAGYQCQADYTCAKWCVSASDCPDGFDCHKTMPARVAATDFGQCTPTCQRPTDGSCSPSPQCGCGGDQSCDGTMNAAGKPTYNCRNAGSAAAYAACMRSTDCVRGTTCVRGVCEPLCSAAASCSERFATCSTLSFNDSSGQPTIELSGFASCTRPCDPGNPNQDHAGYRACPSGQGCLPAEDGRSVCRAVNKQGSSGDLCSLQEDCAPRFDCSKSGSTPARCLAYCRANADCARGVCDFFDRPLFSGAIEWGVCDDTTP